VDTRQTEGLTESVEKHDTLVATSTNDVLYQNPNDALKAVREDYLYWTGKLTDTSWQLSYAIIAANWAVFGSVDKLLGNLWSKLSVSLVIVELGLMLLGAKRMGELHKARIEYAESDLSRWRSEFNKFAGKTHPYPYTKKIEIFAQMMRETKTWLPLIAGALFLIALVFK